ncbi:MAG: carboxyl-terminal processing protease [Candidatus Promineifilaceae bacterium]|jgi:carboxyl-terminal processing protease
MKLFFRKIFPVVLAVQALCMVPEAPAKTLEALPHYEQICKSLFRRLPHEHMMGVPLGDNMSSRAWSNYVAVLDYDRVYFTASDISRFRAYETKLDDMLRVGDMSFAFETFAVYKERLRDRVAYIEQLLDKGFDLEIDEEHAWKRWERKAPWAPTTAVWDDLWRKRIKNEYIRIVLAREATLAKSAATNTVEIAETVMNVATVRLDTVIQVDDAPNTNNIALHTNVVPKIELALDTAEESIIRRYTQSLTVLEDSDAEWVLQNYLNAFTQAFDPHSGFMSPSAAEDFQIEMSLSLVGIGALLRAEDGAAKIVRLIPGGPADRDTSDTRLEPGDKIIAVAQGEEPAVDIIHWPLHRTVRLIRGEMGTVVVLTVVPSTDPTGATTKTVRLRRDEVKLEGQAAKSYVHKVTNRNGETNTLGVIRLPAFYANMKVSSAKHPEFRSASHDVENLITDMKTNNIDGLVLDLRNNGGGSLLEAVQMSGLFIPFGPVVQIKARARSARVLRDSDHGIAYDGPMIVLVNRLSASASEIVAGALQDYGRAIIVGDSKTHGKGTVQTVLNLGRDDKLGQLKVTTASYHCINGASTQLNGVPADIVLSSPWDFTDTGEEFLRNPLPWSRLPPAAYARMVDLSPIIERVSAASVERRESNDRFKTYMSLMRRVSETTRRDTYPLNISERRAMNASERELEKMQAEIIDEQSDGAAGGDDASLVRDLVLRETLQILSDTILLHNGLGAGQGKPKSSVSSGDPLIDWLKSGL